MAPVVMDCKVDGCQFAITEYEPAVAVELLKLHDKNNHTQATGGSTAGDSRNRVKFKQPEIDQSQSLEEWETFLTRWEEYKKQMKVDTGSVSGQLISCASNELETSLRRVLGQDFYNEQDLEFLTSWRVTMARNSEPRKRRTSYVSGESAIGPAPATTPTGT